MSHFLSVCSDNPDTDIYGANLYARYLRGKQRHVGVSSIGNIEFIILLP